MHILYTGSMYNTTSYVVYCVISLPHTGTGLCCCTPSRTEHQPRICPQGMRGQGLDNTATYHPAEQWPTLGESIKGFHMRLLAWKCLPGIWSGSCHWFIAASLWG